MPSKDREQSEYERNLNQSSPRTPTQMTSSPPTPLRSKSEVVQENTRDRTSMPISDLRPAGRFIEYWCAVAVAEELHFTRAANRLHIDQSALSRHIQKLESSLGLKLFIRGERRVELTEAAEAFIPFAKKALLAGRAGARIAQAISRGEPQEFEVGYSTAVDAHLITESKALMDRARPSIPVRFRSFGLDQLLRRLFDGSTHAAFALLPVNDEFATECVLREEVSLVVPLGHSLSSRTDISVSAIGDEEVIWPVGVTPLAVKNDVFMQFRKRGYTPNVTHEAQTLAEALGLTREGMGITFVKSSDRALVGDGLKVLSLVATVFIETGLVYIRERRWDFLTDFAVRVKNHFLREG